MEIKLQSSARHEKKRLKQRDKKNQQAPIKRFI